MNYRQDLCSLFWIYFGDGEGVCRVAGLLQMASVPILRPSYDLEHPKSDTGLALGRWSQHHVTRAERFLL